MKNIYKECKGCQYTLHNRKTDIECMIRYEKELVQTCPCKICIVKMMCEDMCYQRYVLYSKLSNKRKTHLAHLMNGRGDKLRNEKYT